jgi:hypothetical protein
MSVRPSPRRLLPSVAAYGALLAAALLADVCLHLLHLASIGRWLGPVGAVVLLASFAYSLRKRGFLQSAPVKQLLRGHELLGWVGALLLIVHAGIHFNALLPWLAVAAMLAVVASGLTGQYLLADARAGLEEQERALKAQGLGPREIEQALLGPALLVGAMKRWRRVHMPITMLFVGLALVHAGAALAFGSWQGPGSAAP